MDNWPTKEYSGIRLSSKLNKNLILENILSSDTKKESDFNYHTKDGVVLFGAGKLGRMAKEFLDYKKIPILYVIDIYAQKYKKDPFWKNTKILHPDQIFKNKKEKSELIIICIVTSPIIPIKKYLQKNGYKKIELFYDFAQKNKTNHPLNNGWSIGKINKKEKDNIKRLFDNLKDNTSQENYLQFLAWRKLKIELQFQNTKIEDDNRFFIDEILQTLKNDEIFLDCGAHKGFVIDKFLKIVKNKYKKIYAIEPDINNLKILKENVKNIKSIKIINKVLSDKNKKIKFYEGFDFASKIHKYGNKIKTTTTMDLLNIPATFIKMHLEGEELNCLKGGIKTIKKYRPIITATIYHNKDGLWKTPLFAIKNLKEYSYFIRMHTWAGAGVVLYCIPKERYEK